MIRGHVTKQGSRILRWAVTEAIQRQPAGSRPRQVKDAIIARRGKEAKNIAKIAAARELLTLVFYGMRDGRIRRPPAAAPPGRMTARQPGARPPAILPPATGREAAEHSAPRQGRGHRRPSRRRGRPSDWPRPAPDANPPHAPRQHITPGTNEGMNAASGLPGRTTGHGVATTAYRKPAPGGTLPCSAPIIGAQAPASRTPPAPRCGRAPPGP